MQQSLPRSFRFSFIVPVYNCEEYLEATLDSVVAQDIGFKDNIQLVLVNDGSTDGTDAICSTYQKAFPENVVYIQQENRGASASRLTGLGWATGEYINFLDADDTWSQDACSEALRMFQLFPEIPFCAARHTFFGARSGPHPLSYKYSSDALIDCLISCNYPHLSLSNAFIKRPLIKEQYFDHRLHWSEDFLVINRILLESPRYAVMRTPIYWYRKRGGKTSAIDRSNTTAAWYFDPPALCYRRLFEESKRLHGAVLPFIQYTIMYDLQWRLKDHVHHPLNKKQLDQYRASLRSLLQDIDDEIIIAQRNLWRDQRLYALSLKHGCTFAELQERLQVFNGMVRLAKDSNGGNLSCWSLGLERKVYIDFMYDKGNCVALEGRISSLFPQSRIDLIAMVDNEEGCAYTVPAQKSVRYDRSSRMRFSQNHFFATGFSIVLPAGKSALYLSIDGSTHQAELHWNQFSGFPSTRQGYCSFGALTIRAGTRSNELIIDSCTRVWKAKREIVLEKELLRRKPLRDKLSYWRVFGYRHYGVFFQQENRQIWLISDRPTAAGDNGEALFTYLQKHPIPGIETYFVINRDSPDYARMKKVGPVVGFGSRRHKLLHMRAQLLASSAADQFVYRRFGKKHGVVRGAERFRFVFLQHGITQNDVSAWLNRYDKNIALLVTASQRERDSFLSHPAFGYRPDQIVCTGFPRHDKLLSMNAEIPPERRILVAPTWRSDIAGKTNPKTGKRLENPMFESTPYFLFFSKLINDPIIGQALKNHGFTMIFAIHPAFIQEAHKFKSDYAEVITACNYAEEFTRSQIMITDYSSVAFDFALLKKPLVYAQADFDEFYAHHSWEQGYYDYKKDGFGPVCSTYEETVEKLIRYMINPSMEKRYEARVDDFFFTPETSRCEAVVNELIKLTNS